MLTLDSNGFVSIKDIWDARWKLHTPGNLLNIVYSLPKTRFQHAFQVYRVSGQGLSQFLLPEIGTRAVQGHSTRNDMSVEFLTAAQERLVLNDDTYRTLPRFCVSWYKHASMAKCLIEQPGV